jgi:hypothetical protein
MTKKDYIIIAKVIKKRFEPLLEAGTDLQSYSIVRCILDDLCEAFWNDNQRFDRDKFLTACGMKEEEETPCYKCDNCKTWDFNQCKKLNKPSDGSKDKKCDFCGGKMLPHKNNKANYCPNCWGDIKPHYD